MEDNLVEFKCAVCGGEFKSPRPEEDAVAELKRNFPDADPGDCEAVCEPCYRKVLKQAMIRQIKASLN